MKSSDRLTINLAVFRAETADLPSQSVGVYLRLILQQWEVGALPNDISKLAVIGGGPVADVISKFEIGNDGLLRAFWVEQLRKRQGRISRLNSDSAKARWHPCERIANALRTQETDICACGCGKSVKPGRKFVDRAHANRYHGQNVFSGKPRENVIQEKAGKGEASETDRYRSSL